MADLFKNFSGSLVATAPSPAASGTSLVVTAAEGALFPAVPFNATIWPTSSQPTAANAEVVRVTGISTDTLTIVRAQESSSARTVVVGDQIAATITAKSLNDYGTLLNGWIDDTAETWTYVSATTFTVPGDQTARFTPGTRLKLTQTTVKYFVVASSTFGASTTVTVTGGSDYTLANAAISLNYHSYMANPQGWPTWFTFTTSVTGFSSTSVDSGVFAVTGRILDLILRVVGTSNATTFGITLPIANAGPQLNAYISTVIAADNGTNAIRRSRFPSTTTLAFDAGLDANDGWTASGTKTVAYVGTYQI